MVQLTKTILPLYVDFPKSKLAKIIRTLFDLAMKVEGRNQELVDLCLHIIKWCEAENRSFLRMHVPEYKNVLAKKQKNSSSEKLVQTNLIGSI